MSAEFVCKVDWIGFVPRLLLLRYSNSERGELVGVVDVLATILVIVGLFGPI
jgi:hypothetical protein